jgi:hypothetical protein
VFDGTAQRLSGGLDLDEIHRPIADDLLNRYGDDLIDRPSVSIVRQPLDRKVNIRIGRVPGLMR